MVHGRARLDGPNRLAVEGADVAGVTFRDCILATGSRINALPPAYERPVWTSADALALPEIPERLLVVGGGYIGLELGQVYAGLGSAVTVVELSPGLLPGADADLVQVVLRACQKQLAGVLLDSRVTGIERQGDALQVTVEHAGERKTEVYDRVLAAVGRRPNSEDLGLERLGLRTDAGGFLPVDAQGRTAAPHLFAIGDLAPGPMLAHKASREGKVAAEAISGLASAADHRAVPAVVFTDPELAWTGLTEREATQRGLPVTVGRFPLAALGRARSVGRTEGLVKVIAQPDSGRILGVGMVGPHVSELIAEGTLAIELGATLEDLLVTIHPHPTFSEALMEAAEVAAGQAVHVPAPARGP